MGVLGDRGKPSFLSFSSPILQLGISGTFHQVAVHTGRNTLSALQVYGTQRCSSLGLS